MALQVILYSATSGAYKSKQFYNYTSNAYKNNFKVARQHLGADSFLLSRDQHQMQAAMGAFDGIIDTVFAVHPLLPLIGLLKSHGKIVMVGAPEKPLELPVFPLLADPHSTRHFFDETSLDLKSVSSILPSSNNYQSVCTHNKVKSALERAEKEPIVRKRTSFLKSPQREINYMDLAAIDAFLAYHHSKESPVVAVLANAYNTFDQRWEKSGARIVWCTPALYVWLVSYLFHHEGRPVCPLQGHRMCAEKGKANWEQLLADMVGASVNWFPRWKEGEARVLSSCEGFSNVPLMGMRVCINYNLVLAKRKLGYPMRGALSEESIASFIARGFSDPNARMFQRVLKAWSAVQRKDKELRGSSNGIVGGYHKWLKARTQEITWLSKLKLSIEEEAETPEKIEEVQALKAELERA
ncbi:putative mannitol dehydrogenase [Glycine soja]